MTVTSEHIDLIIWGARTYTVAVDGTRYEPYDEEQCTRLGRILTDPIARIYAGNGYEYHEPRYTTWSPVEILKAIETYEHAAQTDALSHGETWEGTEAAKAIGIIRRNIIPSLDGYDGAEMYADGTGKPVKWRRAMSDDVMRGIRAKAAGGYVIDPDPQGSPLIAVSTCAVTKPGKGVTITLTFTIQADSERNYDRTAARLAAVQWLIDHDGPSHAAIRFDIAVPDPDGEPHATIISDVTI